MRHGNTKLYRSERAGDGTVHIAEHYSARWPPLHQVRFVPFEDPGRLRAVGARADVEVYFRRGNPQIAKEDVRHRRVVMLSRVNDAWRDGRIGPQPADDRRELHEVWAGASDEIQDCSHDRC